MRKLTIIVAVFALTGTAAYAQTAAPSCKAQADAKKLAGAAQSSFMKKCESDAKMTCETQAKDKKLAGAAKNSFESKCVKDAKGA